MPDKVAAFMEAVDRRVGKQLPKAPFAIATVDPAFTGTGKAKVTFDGQSALSSNGYITLAPVDPGDRVVVLRIGRTWVILGSLTDGAASLGRGNEKFWTATQAGVAATTSETLIYAPTVHNYQVFAGRRYEVRLRGFQTSSVANNGGLLYVRTGTIAGAGTIVVQCNPPAPTVGALSFEAVGTFNGGAGTAGQVNLAAGIYDFSITGSTGSGTRTLFYSAASPHDSTSVSIKDVGPVTANGS